MEMGQGLGTGTGQGGMTCGLQIQFSSYDHNSDYQD